MSAPRIAPLQPSSSVLASAPPLGAWPAGVRVFEVTQTGTFAGRRWQVGQLLLCGGAPESADTVILAPRGPGNARLGTVVGCGVYGDRGEPCSALRWVVSGRILAVIEPRSVAPGGAIPGLGLSLPQGWAEVYPVAEHLGLPTFPSHAPAPTPDVRSSLRRRQARRSSTRPLTSAQLGLFEGSRAHAA